MEWKTDKPCLCVNCVSEVDDVVVCPYCKSKDVYSKGLVMQMAESCPSLKFDIENIMSSRSSYVRFGIEDMNLRYKPLVDNLEFKCRLLFEKNGKLIWKDVESDDNDGILHYVMHCPTISKKGRVGL